MEVIQRKAGYPARLRRCGQRDRQPDGDRAHVQHRRGGHPGADGPGADHPDDVPRPQPPGDAGRPAGRVGAGHAQRPVPVGRPSDVRQSPDRPRTSSTWTRCSSSRWCARWAIRASSSAATRSTARRRSSSSAARPTRSPTRSTSGRLRLAKKAKAGAQFIQTQMIYNVPKFARIHEAVLRPGPARESQLLAGVGPIKSLGAARYMASKVPGMDVPDEIVKRMQARPKRSARKKASRSASRSSSRSARCRAWPAFTSWPSNGKRP